MDSLSRKKMMKIIRFPNVLNVIKIMKDVINVNFWMMVKNFIARNVINFIQVGQTIKKNLNVSYVAK